MVDREEYREERFAPCDMYIEKRSVPVDFKLGDPWISCQNISL